MRASQVSLVVKNPLANARDFRDAGSIPRLGRYPGEGHGNPLQGIFLPRESHGQRRVASYSPWGRRQLDMTKASNLAHTHTCMHLSCDKPWAIGTGGSSETGKAQIPTSRSKICLCDQHLYYPNLHHESPRMLQNATCPKLIQPSEELKHRSRHWALAVSRETSLQPGFQGVSKMSGAPSTKPQWHVSHSYTCPSSPMTRCWKTGNKSQVLLAGRRCQLRRIKHPTGEPSWVRVSNSALYTLQWVQEAPSQFPSQSISPAGAGGVTSTAAKWAPGDSHPCLEGGSLISSLLRQ